MRLVFLNFVMALSLVHNTCFIGNYIPNLIFSVISRYFWEKHWIYNETPQ